MPMYLALAILPRWCEYSIARRDRLCVLPLPCTSGGGEPTIVVAGRSHDMSAYSLYLFSVTFPVDRHDAYGKHN